MGKPTALPFLVVVALVAVMTPPAAALARDDDPTVGDVEMARRCAAAARSAGWAFAEVRDSVRAGGTTRARTLLGQADEALAGARAACRHDAEVSAALDELAADSAGLARSLDSSSR